MESVISTREEVLHFLSITPILGSGDGCGSGSGDGDGSGCGYGCGSGSGSGDGDGDGDGSGCSYGCGYGSGYGSGCSYGCSYGCGYGYGCGYSCGYGCGYGYGCGDIKALNGNIVDYIDSVPTIITQVRGNIACGYIVKKDLTLEPCYIAKAGNYFAHGSTLKEAVADAEEKEMEDMPIEERIKKFVETFGPLDSEHTGKEFYDWHHILTGSCRMGRDKFCEENGIDLTKKYSVRYFLNITKNSYGGDIIKQIINELTKE